MRTNRYICPFSKIKIWNTIGNILNLRLIYRISSKFHYNRCYWHWYTIYLGKPWGPFLYGFICDLASNLGEVLLHTDTDRTNAFNVFGQTKNKWNAFTLFLLLSFISSSSAVTFCSFSLFFITFLHTLTGKRTFIQKTFNDHNNPGFVRFSVFLYKWALEKKWSLVFLAFKVWNQFYERS